MAEVDLFDFGAAAREAVQKVVDEIMIMPKLRGALWGALFEKAPQAAVFAAVFSEKYGEYV